MFGNEIDDRYRIVWSDALEAIGRNVSHHLDYFFIGCLKLEDVASAQHSLKRVVILWDDVGWRNRSWTAYRSATDCCYR